MARRKRICPKTAEKRISEWIVQTAILERPGFFTEYQGFPSIVVFFCKPPKKHGIFHVVLSISPFVKIVVLFLTARLSKGS
jgi:hypothetical protein